MRNKQLNAGFTLLETVLAISLSALVLALLARAMNGIYRIDHAVQERETIMRNGYMLFDVLEKDFGSALLLPHLAQQQAEQSAEKGNASKTDTRTVSAQKKGRANEGNELGPFVGEVYDEVFRTIGKKKMSLFKNVRLLTAHPLMNIGASRIAPVRVGYKLLAEPKAHKDDPTVYRLERYETHEIKYDPLARYSEGSKSPVQQVVVARDIKAMSIRYLMPRVRTEEAPMTEQQGPYASFVWGVDETTRNKIPKWVVVYIEFWNTSRTGVYGQRPLRLVVPVQSFDAQRAKKQAQQPAERADTPVDAAQKTPAEGAKPSMPPKPVTPQASVTVVPMPAPTISEGGGSPLDPRSATAHLFVKGGA